MNLQLELGTTVETKLEAESIYDFYIFDTLFISSFIILVFHVFTNAPLSRKNKTRLVKYFYKIVGAYQGPRQ